MVDFAENPILRINDDEDDYRLMTVGETQDLPSNIQSYASKVCTLRVCTTSSITIPSVSTSTSNGNGIAIICNTFIYDVYTNNAIWRPNGIDR